MLLSCLDFQLGEIENYLNHNQLVIHSRLTNLLWTDTISRFPHLESSCSSKYELLAASKNL